MEKSGPAILPLLTLPKRLNPGVYLFLTDIESYEKNTVFGYCLWLSGIPFRFSAKHESGGG